MVGKMGSSGSQARKLHKPFNTCAQKPYRIVYWGDQLRDTDNPLDIEIVWFVCPWRLFSFQFCGKENCINVSRKWRCLKFRHYFCISAHIHNAQTKGTLHKLMVKSVHKGRWLLTVVDPEDMRNIPPPPSQVQLLSFSCSFRQKLCKIPSGKFWIPHCGPPGPFIAL